MVRHIVMFRLVPFASAEAKQAKLDEIKQALEALRGKIDVLRSIRVDFNCNPAEEYDLILTTEMDTLADVSAYALHPEHVAVSKELIGPVKAGRACVDYEF